MTKKHTLVLKLRRHSSRPWGIRIAGGADLGTPIIVTRVSLFYIHLQISKKKENKFILFSHDKYNQISIILNTKTVIFQINSYFLCQLLQSFCEQISTADICRLYIEILIIKFFVKNLEDIYY